MEKQYELGQWLSDRCRREHLSLRKAGAKTGLSGATIAQVVKNSRASPETIRKLARGFGGNGRLALEDYLLTLAGHRSKQPEGEELTYLEVVPLLSPEYQHILEVLVGELAQIEGIEISLSPAVKAEGSEPR
jgi:transcriptional regulator with XRE-family HTH domain